MHYAPTLGAAPPGFEVVEGGATRFVPMRGVITVNNSEAYQASCLAGLGLIQAPELGMRTLLAEGRLVEVLPSLQAAPMPVSVLYAHSRNISKRVQAVMDWLAEVLTPHLDPDAGIHREQP